MCGIVGIIGYDKKDLRDRITAMVAAVAHRGPDSRNIVTISNGALGHTRLTIIDLNDRSLQPMISRDLRYTLTFNGEIYNYKEIRKELIKVASIEFVTTSDTEVLLHAFIVWGESCLERLNGMFAFCVHDAETGRVFLARDRFGQKPLFYIVKKNTLFFSSEIKALFSAGVKPKSNRTTWSRYLYYASFDDDHTTFFENIYQLLPGECAWFEEGLGVIRKQYYNLGDRKKIINISYDDAVIQTRKIMAESVSRHLRSDVPVGISLSGGLDSSSILSSLEVSGQLNNGLKSFSMEYGDDLSERVWIDSTVSRYGLSSYYGTFTKKKFIQRLTSMMWHQEAPIGGLPNCALEEVAQAALSTNTKVLLDGTGLDEIFAGYRNMHNMYLGLLMQNKTDAHFTRALKEYMENWCVGENTAINDITMSMNNIGSAIDGTSPVRVDCLTKETIKLGKSSFVAPNIHGNLLQTQMIDYLQVRKIPRNMRMKDRVTMSYGLELRLPFLDHELVEFALSLPQKFYFTKGMSKSIVREAMSGFMHNDVRLAAKRSIQAPQELWLKTSPMREYIMELLSSESFASRGFIEQDKAIMAYNDFCKKGANNSFFIWQWINLEIWHRIFIDNDPLVTAYPAYVDITGFN